MSDDSDMPVRRLVKPRGACSKFESFVGRRLSGVRPDDEPLPATGSEGGVDCNASPRSTPRSFGG
jgi:hypothetical protein